MDVESRNRILLAIMFFSILITLMMFGLWSGENQVREMARLEELYLQCDQKVHANCGFACWESLCEKDGVLYPVIDEKIYWENPK